MKSLGFSLVLCCLVCFGSGFSQEVTRISRPYVVLDIEGRSDVSVGDELLLYRFGVSGDPVAIARVEIVRIRGTNCAARIIFENPDNPVQLGDRLIQLGEMGVKESLTQPAGRRQYIPKRSHWISYLTVSAGLISCGLGYYFYYEAEEASIVEPVSYEHQARLADSIRRYDNASNFSYYLGGGLIAAGVVHYFLTRNRPVQRYQAINIQPIQKKGFYGMGLQFALKR